MVKRLVDRYIEYNPDSDLCGSGEKDYGHQLAEAMMKAYNYDNEKVPKLTKQNKLETKANPLSEKQRKINQYHINRIKKNLFGKNSDSESNE